MSQNRVYFCFIITTEKNRLMKTLTKTTALILITFLASLNIMATGIEFEQEDYIDDIPFDLEEVEIQARYENAILIDFSFNEEEFINDMPFDDQYLTSLNLYYKAIAESFSFENEHYINDMPFSTSPNHKKPSEEFYARALQLK